VSRLNLGVVSTFPPREDGLATFTRDLLGALRIVQPNLATRVAAITDPSHQYTYPRAVLRVIEQGVPSSYSAAARTLNAAPLDLVMVQHEFTLFGHWDAAHEELDDYTPALLDGLNHPVILTLHTVLPQPRQTVRDTVRYLYDRSAALVVMANTAVSILERDYNLDPSRMVVIPHGVPELPRGGSHFAKRALGLEGRTVLCTFGLLRRSKGIEDAIKALPEIVARHPEVIYIILGATHPEVRQLEGEAYRRELGALADRLGVSQHVRLINGYLEQQDLLRYLQSTDIYLTPYHDRDQIASGTLAYALGFGLAIVSTPYIYAVEALAEGRGLLAEFSSPPSIARCVNRYLDNPTFMRATRDRARAYSRDMEWLSVAQRYAALFERVIDASGSLLQPAL
jgi:glycosyltransferase involved in cell wall biosynthesis